MKQTISIPAPFGALEGVLHECCVAENRNHVLIMAHGFRGSMDGGGRAALLAEEISKNIFIILLFLE